MLYFCFGFIVALIIWWIIKGIIKVRWNKEKVYKQTIFDLVECSKDVIYHYEVKPDQKFLYVSPSIEKFLGKGVIEEEAKDPKAPFKRIHPDDHELLYKKINGEIDYNQKLVQRWKDNDGNYKWFEEYATPVYKNGEIIAIQGILRNIDEKVMLQQDLEYRINHDTLTDIYNREYFEAIFTKYNEEFNVPIAILLFDLDELKITNDNCGHRAGDALIKKTANILNEFSSDNVTVSRLGGDEFVILVANHTAKDAEQLERNILAKFKNDTSNIKISVGYAFSANSIGQMPKLFTEADKKMYSNKNERKQLLNSEKLV